jgi:hypothetical protein
MVVSASGGGLGFQLTTAESEFQSQKMTEVKIDRCPIPGSASVSFSF